MWRAIPVLVVILYVACTALVLGLVLSFLGVTFAYEFVGWGIVGVVVAVIGLAPVAIPFAFSTRRAPFVHVTEARPVEEVAQDVMDGLTNVHRPATRNELLRKRKH